VVCRDKCAAFAGSEQSLEGRAVAVMCDPCSVKEPALGSSVGAGSKQTTLLVLVLVLIF
jgi:hypothetical protein